MSGDCMGEGVWVMQKRKHEPQVPGSRRYMLREPDRRSRFAAFLDTIGLEHSEDASNQTVVDKFLAQNPTEDQTAAFLALQEDLDKRSTKRKRRGSPGNNRAFQVLVFMACETERQLQPVPGSVSVRADVAAALGLVPDTVGKAWKAGRGWVLAAAREGQVNTTGHGPLVLASMRFLRLKVAEIWPEFRLRYRRLH